MIATRLPRIKAPLLDNIPEALKDGDRMVCWKYLPPKGKSPKPRKIPVNPYTGENGSSTDPKTWGTLDDVLFYNSQHDNLGIGRVIRPGEMVMVDLDDCRDPKTGKVTEFAEDIISKLGTYTEVSPSGTGLKAFGFGTKPSWSGCKKKFQHKETKEPGGEVEVYDSGRYGTLTGQVYGDFTEAIDITEQVEALCRRVWSKEAEAADKASTTTKTTAKAPATTSTDTAPAVAAMLRITPYADENDGSGRLFAWTCRGVEHHLEDDAIVSAVREAAKTYPLPVDYTDAQILDRVRDAHKKTRPKENLLPAEMPVVDLGGKVRLLPVEVSRSAKRRTLRAEVEINGENTEMEVVATDTPGGVRGAWSSILEFAGFVNHTIEPDDAEAIKPALAKLLTAKQLDAIGAKIDKATPRISTAPTGPSMADVVRKFLVDDLDLAFVVGEPAAVWSEAQGRYLRRNEITNHVPSSLRAAIARCHDYPEPTPADPTKDIKQLLQVNKAAWCDIVPTLPAQGDATLGPDSKAAEAFRANLLRLWTSPETWMRFEAQGGEPACVERMSLASRVRELRHKRSSPVWHRVLKGTASYYRVEDDGQVWIGMRHDLLDQIKRHDIAGIRGQSDLSKIMRRYGLVDETGITDRYRDRETGKRDRIVVLSRELADLFVDGIDPDDESTGPESDADDGPVLAEGVAIDPVTGEVIDE